MSLWSEALDFGFPWNQQSSNCKEQVEEFEYPDDLSEFQLVSQIELKPKKMETLIFTIEEHRKACTINLSYFIQRYEGQKETVRRDSLNKNQWVD